MNEPKITRFWPVVTYSNHIDVKQEWLNIAKNYQYNRMKIDNGWISKDLDILNHNFYSDLKSELKNHIHEYVTNTLKIKNKFDFTTSWIVKQEKNDWGQLHIHKNSIISGVYYLNTPPNCGDIQFNRYINPLLTETFVFDITEDTLDNADTIKVKVNEGLLLLFPSNLHHSIEITLSDEPRYCIAFNLFPSDIIGETTISKLPLKVDLC